MTVCSVPGCSSKSQQGLSLFGLPKNEKLCEKWLRFLQNCGKSVNPLKHFSICELHFNKSAIVQGTIRKFVMPGAVPIFRINQERKLKWVKRRHKFIELHFQVISAGDKGNCQEYEDYEELQENTENERVPDREENEMVPVQEDKDQVGTKLWLMTKTDWSFLLDDHWRHFSWAIQ